MMQNICGNLGKIRKCSANNNIWSLAVPGHGASWSLVVSKGQGGPGWELVTPCARSAVANIVINNAGSCRKT